MIAIDTHLMKPVRVLWLRSNQPHSFGTCHLGPGTEITAVDDLSDLSEYLSHMDFDVVLGPCGVPEISADDILQTVTAVDRNIPVVLHGRDIDIDEAIRLTKLGVYHVLTGEPSPDKSAEVFTRARQARQNLRPADPEPGGSAEPWRRMLIGSSRPMHKLIETIRLVGPRSSAVLVSGETGTGKEVVARALHMASERRNAPFVAVNCGAIPENLIEAELFGHVKGAFTGALQSRIGRFEQANGGTIFLDEVGELPFELQAKLLRVLQEREVQRIGSSETVRLNVRVIAATNIDLQRAVSERRFRQDLFYRLNVVPVRLPALRERIADVPALARHFIRLVAAAEGMEEKTLTPEALDCLTSYSWPGNIRELEHAVETAMVLSGDRHVLHATDFELSALPQRMAQSKQAFIEVPDEGLNFDEVVRRVERTIVEQALRKTGGNKARAAEMLGMKRTTLLAKLKTFAEPLHACA
jgi:DNA-binding NtrC family response regulator